MSWSKKEFNIKLQRIRRLMSDKNLENVLITSPTNFFWLTGGRPYVNINAQPCAEIIITVDKIYVLSNNIEGERLISEELKGLPIESVRFPWWEPDAKEKVLRDLTGEGKVCNDIELSNKISKLRWDLLPEEQERFFDTGNCVAKILETVAFKIKPGDTEQDVANMIKKVSCDYDLNPWVNLVGADDRTFKYRHLLPTEKKIEKYVIISISGQKHGLTASATRIVSFGDVTEELKKRHDAILKIDTAFIGATKPGTQICDIFKEGKKAYEVLGYKNEWMNHHQGGMAGYNSRELKGTDYCDEIVKPNQVYAWNPTIAGTKSEDTILVQEDGIKILTETIDFPTVEVEFDGLSLKRPGILKK